VRYLVDTDWVIHYLNGRSNVVHQLQQFSREGLALSVVSVAELWEGVYYSRDPARSERALGDFLRGVRLVGIDDGIAKVFGMERGRLRAAHKTVGDLDLLIGATALHLDLVLLTNNRRHFELIEGLRITSI
jgi:tRNA(fMet)-specific endonuclease VapC